MQRIEIGHAKTRNLACALQSIELESCLHVARQSEVPPVKLHEVETLHAEPSQGSIDDAFDVAAVQCLQLGQIGYELRMHLDAPGERRVGATEGTNECLDAGVDVGAVEGRHAGL